MSQLRMFQDKIEYKKYNLESIRLKAKELRTPTLHCLIPCSDRHFYCVNLN